MATVSQVPAGATHPVPAHKWLVALAVMLGTALEVLDTSIVNVALPHMQGAFSASVDEIAWVLTSYLVANGIMIPMTAWISSRFGRSRCSHRLCAAQHPGADATRMEAPAPGPLLLQPVSDHPDHEDACEERGRVSAE